jgi:unsaturated rhamnogalacturonyl hydrolase
MRSQLERLVHGLTGLRHDGRFDEPNLDGTAGDYISFDSWEWPQGIGLYGLVRLWQHTGDETLRRTVEDWYTRRLAAGLPQMNINTTAPMLALSLLWGATRDARWEKPLADWAEGLMRDMPRTPEGGFQHNVSDRVNDDELWDDTLFMAALFLAAYGKAANRPACTDEAVRQFLVHARYLADPVSGLWFHGWTFGGRHNFARALWARGNAWITVGILDLIEIGSVADPVRGYLLGVLETQIEALLMLQAPSGAWHTLLDDPTSYEEMSATRLGIGPNGTGAAGLRALDAVVANIGEDGVLQNVSYGTRMGHDLDHYRDIPIQPTGYGQALAILCLTEGMIHAEAMEKAA